MTFAVEGSGCGPANWNSCPSNIGDVEMLRVDDSLHSITLDSDKPSQIIKVSELQSGSAGNNRTDSDDSGAIALSLSHSTLEVSVGIDAIEHIEMNGLYQIYYTPIKSGHFTIYLQINNDALWTDLSSGVTVIPTRPDAIHSYHDANLAVKAGKFEEFSIFAVDVFGNRLSSNLEDGYEFTVHLTTSPDACSGKVDIDDIAASVQSVPERNGRYIISYMPQLAGTSSLSMNLRSKGGLLTTYFFNPDFTHPLLEGNSSGQREGTWCPQLVKNVIRQH